jgi:hypothetical protein
VFRHVVRVAVDDTRRLPAHKVTLRIRAEPINAIQVGSPLSPGFYRFLADGLQRYACRRVPNVVLLIDSSLALPSGIPRGVVAFLIQIDGQIDPVAGGRDLELALVLDVRPIVTQKKLNHVAVPEFEAIFSVIGGQPEI